MKSVRPSPYVDYNQIIKDSDRYCDDFIKNGFLLFKKINLSEKQQVNFIENFGKKLNWDLYDIFKNQYIENHARVMDFKQIPSNEYIISWHVERLDLKDPIIAATWNMINFKCNNENGQTHFIDTEEIYKRMPKEWKEFLSKSTEKINSGENIIDCVQPHWFTKNPVLRINLQNLDLLDSLHKVNNVDASDEQKIYFNEIRSFYFNQILYDKDIKIFHKWDQGDFLLVDLFKMAHNVTGGFSSKDRKFIGYWIYKSKLNKVENI